MLTINQNKLFEEIDILPIDLKTKLVEEILQSITPLNSSIDNLWIEEVNKRKTNIEMGNVSLIDGSEVFQKIFSSLPPLRRGSVYKRFAVKL